MNQLEADFIDVFRLSPVQGLPQFAETAIKWAKVEFMLDIPFGGLLPSQDTQAQRDSTKGMIWPDPSIRAAVEQVGEPSVGAYFKRLDQLLKVQLPRQQFTLLMAALDGFLERKGHHGTLGQRFNSARGAVTIPPQVVANMHEIIQRRNDTAHHGGVVSADYVNATKYSSLKSSTWLTRHALPAQGAPHDYDGPGRYLFWCAAAIKEFALLVP